MRGTLWILEGLDGCGKSTQLPLVSAALAARGFRNRVISFPDYADPSSAPVQLYLQGKLGAAEAVNAYAASSFYAVDRYCAYRQHWGAAFEAGESILAGRYVSSNAIYQMTKLPRDAWDAYLAWLADYEYEKLGLPRPDRVVYLDLPLAAAQQRLLKRYHGDAAQRDVHERDVSFLTRCHAAAQYVAEQEHWIVLPCTAPDGSIIPIETMTSRIVSACLDTPN